MNCEVENMILQNEAITKDHPTHIEACRQNRGRQAHRKSATPAASSFLHFTEDLDLDQTVSSIDTTAFIKGEIETDNEVNVRAVDEQDSRFTIVAKNPAPLDVLVCDDVTISFAAMEVHRRGQLVALTRKEFKTLEYLLKNARRVVSRDELLNEVWGYDCYPCTRTVDNHILRLRKKLEREPARPKHLRTVHGTGYKFLP
jgi:hypothetical protein